MVRRISVVLQEPVAQKLTALADRELRGTREQATVLLTEAVERETRRLERRSGPRPEPAT